MRKSTLSVSVVAALLAISGPLFCHPAMALDTQNSQYESYCRTPILEQFGDIDRSQTVTINGVENPLYCTFVDSEAALAKLREVAPDILLEIANEFSLDELSSDNWEYYKYGALNLLETSSFAADDDIQKQTLGEFFDIYENDVQNEIIKEQASSIEKSRSRSITQDQVVSLGVLLPAYAPLAQRSENIINMQQQFTAYALPNINAAVAYAEKYAVNPNSDGYGVAKGGITTLWSDMDCTNFVSQILEASGVGQVVYNDTNSGWWHKKNGNSHTYSASWINSDIFARYMGVGYSSTNHRDFANNIARGDFITLDKTNDGSWDHMGFVTAIGAELCYKNGTYRDYKIAQHTSNYHDWASNRNWPTAAQKWGRVRR